MKRKRELIKLDLIERILKLANEIKELGGGKIRFAEEDACGRCNYYDFEEERCGAFVRGVDCPELPCGKYKYLYLKS